MLVLRHSIVEGLKLEDQMVGVCQQEYQNHSQMCRTALEENLVSLMETAHSEYQVQD